MRPKPRCVDGNPEILQRSDGGWAASSPALGSQFRAEEWEIASGIAASAIIDTGSQGRSATKASLQLLIWSGSRFALVRSPNRNPGHSVKICCFEPVFEDSFESP